MTGTSCEELVAREFWQDEQLVSRACYVFLRMSSGGSLGWFFNDDKEVWQADLLGAADFPPIEEFTTDDGSVFRYPQTDLAAQFELRGKALSRWVAGNPRPVAEARLEFADGSAVLFEYDCRTERDFIGFHPGDPRRDRTTSFT
jgi:hypothetical protein